MKRFYYSRYLLSLVFIFLTVTAAEAAEQEKEGKHSEALLKQVREQYERDLEASKKKHTAEVIMGSGWGKLNAKDEIRYQLVRVYVEKENYEKALGKLNEIIVQSPDPKARMRAFCTRATIYEIGLDKPREALKEYRQAVSVRGNHYVGITAGAYLAMAEIYLQSGDRSRAKLILEESYRSLNYIDVTPVSVAKELVETEK